MSKVEETTPSQGDLPVARLVFLAVAFAGLVAIAVFTVLLPSLEDAPTEANAHRDAGAPTAPATPSPPTP